MELIVYEKDLVSNWKDVITNIKVYSKKKCPTCILNNTKSESKRNIDSYCFKSLCSSCYNEWHIDLKVIKNKKGNMEGFKNE